MDGVLFYKQKIYLDATSDIIPVIIEEMHAATHEGGDKTIYRIKQVLRWKGLTKTVREFIRNCHIGQQHKSEQT